MVDIETILESLAQRRKLLSEAGEANKQPVFDALSAAGIDIVTVTFDGEGDSGQIDNVVAYKGETESALPIQTLTLRSVSWNPGDTTTQDMPLSEAIETLCYDFLEQKYAGWENNDGAFGEFTLRVADRTIELEFNGRFSDVHTSSHTF
jgi:hypothetical protein